MYIHERIDFKIISFYERNMILLSKLKHDEMK